MDMGKMNLLLGKSALSFSAINNRDSRLSLYTENANGWGPLPKDSMAS